MSPKIARVRDKTIAEGWAAEAGAVQDLLEAALPEHFPKVTLLDRNSIGTILEEKKLAILGDNPQESVEAMRLLGADFLIRPVVNLANKELRRADKVNPERGFEITLVVIRSSDGLVCSSVMHRGPYEIDSVLKMVPKLRFPSTNKEAVPRDNNRDAQLRQWEADFYLALGSQKDLKAFRNPILEQHFAFTCLKAAHSLQINQQELAKKILPQSYRCMPKVVISLQRSQHKKIEEDRYRQARLALESTEVEKDLRRDTRRFFDAISDQLDTEHNPHNLVLQANYAYNKGDFENALRLLEKYRTSNAVETDPRLVDNLYYFTGIRAHAALNHYNECAEWILSRPTFDRYNMLLLSDCFAAMGDSDKEYSILKQNRRFIPAGEIHSQRLLDLAREHDDTEFVFNYILYQLSGWDYNKAEFQWQLCKALEAAREIELQRGILAGIRQRNDYGPEFFNYEQWEKDAERLGVKDNPAYQRRFPAEINPIGEDRIIELIPVADHLLTQESLAESAQNLATLIGCPVKLFSAIPKIEQPGVYDFQGRFYYEGQLSVAAALALPPAENAVDRILLTNSPISIYHPSTKTSGVRVYRSSSPYGFAIAPRSLMFMPDSRLKYWDSIVLCNLGLSNLWRYARNHIESTGPLRGFTKNSPNPTGSNGTYNVADTVLGSYDKINADIYSKIDWAEYLELYQTKCKELRSGGEHQHLAKAAKHLTPLLKKASAEAKIFFPKKEFSDVEIYRSFDKPAPVEKTEEP